MTNEEWMTAHGTLALDLIKADLQRAGRADQESYLQHLLETALLEIQGYGVHLSEEADITSLVVSYASFLFRSRADMGYSQTMPRHLDRRIKQMIWRQCYEQDV